MLAFSNDYYGMIFRATQSVELFCAYDEIVHFELLGQDFYLWYYLNLTSNHSGDTLSYEIRE